jgi:Ni,Fe-hydrogenase III large subunit/Ni,Fe-hydrogenase III component G
MLATLIPTLTPLASPVPMRRGSVDSAQWLAAARAVADAGGRLVALWGRERMPPNSLAVCTAYAIETGLVCLELQLPAGEDRYPDLSGIFPAAARMQRAVTDLLGAVADGAADQRPWLDHGAWTGSDLPLRSGTERDLAHGVADYPFVRVEGDGVHEIPVGPVHAGIIEPGHFRFSIVGERTLRLEQRLGYVHKGVERRFTELPALEACRLAGRISGDSTVAYAWACAMALESATGTVVPERAAWLRALLLERERVANHLGDLGALGNDAAFGFGLAQFSRLREDWQRLSQRLFGHRLLMDRIVPGGVAVDLASGGGEQIATQCAAFDRELRTLRGIYDEHAGLQDRFITTGRIPPELAARLGLTGLAGRASAQAVDLRCDHPWAPYDRLEVNMATHRNGDVAARVTVRFDEVFESLRLIGEIVHRLPPGPVLVPPTLPAAPGFGAGWVEGWRGEIFVALDLDGAAGGHRIRRCHCHDPSWQNWPVLEHAVVNDIVPDFPLINKSFNLSYSGHDL